MDIDAYCERCGLEVISWHLNFCERCETDALCGHCLADHPCSDDAAPAEADEGGGEPENAYEALARDPVQLPDDIYRTAPAVRLTPEQMEHPLIRRLMRPARKPSPCAPCGGSGVREHEDLTGCPRWSPCPSCAGTGRAGGEGGRDA